MQEPKDGWSVVGFNIAKNCKKKCYMQIFSSEHKRSFFFGVKNLKSQRYERLGFFSVFFDLLNILFCLKKVPDIIHCNVEHYAIVAMILSKILRVPYTITCHGTYGVLLPQKYPLFKKAYEHSAFIIAVSNYTKKRMIQEEVNAKYVVINNGVDKKIFKPKLGLKKRKPYITFVGNLKERKGLQFILDSMIFVKKLRSDIKLLVLGDVDVGSDIFSEKASFIKENSLNVEFTGRLTQRELVSHYQNATLNVLPSQSIKYHFEGFGLIHLEANACGTLTVGCADSGNEDAVNPKFGFLVNYGDTKKLSKIILDIFSKKSYPLIKVDKAYDWLEVSKNYLNLWQSLI